MRMEKHTNSRPPIAGGLLAGIDVGGTKILGGLVSSDGKVVFEHRMPTRREHLLEDIVDVGRAIVAEAGHEARAIGIGTTGYVDRENGVLRQSMNMGIGGLPLAKSLTEATGLPVFVENDVHAATVGEIHFGAGRRYEDFILYNAGTGLATGMVFAGRLHRGASNYAGENGHMSIDQSHTTICRCGCSGCVESLLLAARKGIDTVPAYLPRIEAPENKEYGYLALNLVQLINLLNPPAVVLAGGMFNGNPAATEWVKRAVRAHALPNALLGLREIELSRNAHFTGLIGAAALTREAATKQGLED